MESRLIYDNEHSECAGVAARLLGPRSRVDARTSMGRKNLLWPGERAKPFVGPPRNSAEISAFKRDTTKLAPLESMLITPSEGMGDPQHRYWNRHFGGAE